MDSKLASTAKAYDPTITSLPYLPAKTRIRFDHASFRIPGNAFSKQRAEAIEAAIRLLAKETKGFEQRLARLREAYLSRKEVEEVERMRLEALDRTSHDNDQLLRVLERVKERFDKTNEALESVFTPMNQSHGSPVAQNRQGAADAEAGGKKGLERRKRKLERKKLEFTVELIKREVKEFRDKDAEDPEDADDDLEEDGGITDGNQQEIGGNEDRAEERRDNESDESDESDDLDLNEGEEEEGGDGSKATVGVNGVSNNSGLKQRRDSGKYAASMSGAIEGDEPKKSIGDSTTAMEPKGDGNANVAERSRGGISTGKTGEDAEESSKLEEPPDPSYSRDGEPTQRLHWDLGDKEVKQVRARLPEAEPVDEAALLGLVGAAKGANTPSNSSGSVVPSDLYHLGGLAPPAPRPPAPHHKRSTTQRMDDLEKEIKYLENKILAAILKESKQKDISLFASVKDESLAYKQLRENEYEARKEELAQLNKDSRRLKRLVKIKREVNDHQEYLSASGFGRSTHSRRRRREYWQYQDSSSESSDNGSNNEEDKTEQTRRILEILKRIEVLEERVVQVQRTTRDIRQIQTLQTALQRELFLETAWMKSQASIDVRSRDVGELVSQGGGHHFSSAFPAELEIYNRPLERGEIRLLVVSPAPSMAYPLLCALDTQELDLDNPPDYAALSYHWGDSACNGRLYLVPKRVLKSVGKDPGSWGHAIKYAFRIPIRNNLFRALLRLRRQDVTVSLWVDFMCINQKDMGEKTQQLGEMVNIYNSAKNVCIWLGEGDDDGHSKSAMEFVTEIMDFARLHKYLADPTQVHKWLNLAELMRDRWFSRRWVVQEISLASERATVHCGEQAVHWVDFADAVSLLASNQGSIRRLLDAKDFRDGHDTLGEINSFGACILLDSMSKLFHTKASGQGDSSRLKLVRPLKSLESLVTSLKTFDASDTRDLVYSLVCIASDTDQASAFYPGKQNRSPKGKHKHTLEVDYSKPAIEVYRDFISFCIASSRCLDIICRPWAMPVVANKTAADSAEGALPSWIPLLSSSEFGEPENVYSGRKNGESLVGPADQRNYKASTKDAEGWKFISINGMPGYPGTPESEEPSSGVATVPVERNILRARGFILAKIGRVSPRTTGGVILREALALGGWTGITRHDRVPDRIWRSLVADRDGQRQIPPTWYQRACYRCLELADTFNNGDLNIRELLQGHSETLREYLERVRRVTWNRRFFRGTRNPDYWDREREKESTNREYWGEPESEDSLFGIGPPDMQEDDFICILDGCSVPVVLREQPPDAGPSGMFRLVGEVYVHDNMGGEAEEGHDRCHWKDSGVFYIV
ncbi:uncharacterized protein DNG_05052 [Cephalotrichum gorgonifer]|uniref:Heterokaryon incompatibility domain-containing protein n=1 Tax=Cephalotrichum gorgonifer TaxID=2041049 RepID=A0AAE8MZA2_9PEZI|nr:uncharacterized protein DNG_05052 [Cephalotrichum gorgonifer]